MLPTQGIIAVIAGATTFAITFSIFLAVMRAEKNRSTHDDDGH